VTGRGVGLADTNARAEGHPVFSSMPMRRLAVTIRLESPLVLAERKPGEQFVQSLDYIPGARLRGAVAQLLLEEGVCPPAHREQHAHCAVADRPFGALFDGPSPAVFRDALPGSASDVLPLTAVSCRRVPGFHGLPGREGGHGVFDTLLDRTCWEVLAPAGLLYRPCCPVAGCSAPVERYRAYYGRRAVAGALRYFTDHVPVRLLARAAVDRGRRVVAAEAAYTLPALSETYHDSDGVLRPSVFHGEVLVPDDANGALLAEALTRVERLGRGGSRGFGAVRITVAEAPSPSPLAVRLERFARAMGHRRTQYGRLAPLSAASLEGAYFAIDLRSDAILRRGGWEPTTVLDADLLRAATGVADPSLVLVRAYAEPGWRGGWHGAWGLPRPPELVARRGSCYLFRTARLDPWLAALERLEQHGIGARVAEGYGEVRVCDPFHLVLREQAV